MILGVFFEPVPMVLVSGWSLQRLLYYSLFSRWRLRHQAVGGVS